MREMFVNLFFPDPRRLGKPPGTHLLFAQEDDHLLTNRLHVTPMYFLLHLGNSSIRDKISPADPRVSVTPSRI